MKKLFYVSNDHLMSLQVVVTISLKFAKRVKKNFLTVV